MNIKKYFDFNGINFQSIIFGVRLINDVPKIILLDISIKVMQSIGKALLFRF